MARCTERPQALVLFNFTMWKNDILGTQISAENSQELTQYNLRSHPKHPCGNNTMSDPTRDTHVEKIQSQILPKTPMWKQYNLRSYPRYPCGKRQNKIRHHQRYHQRHSFSHVAGAGLNIKNNIYTQPKQSHPQNILTKASILTIIYYTKISNN